MRTQIYLTEQERDELAALARATGKNQSELIREAVDRLLRGSTSDRKLKALQGAAGLWEDRNDLPDFDAIRRSWDRPHAKRD